MQMNRIIFIIHGKTKNINSLLKKINHVFKNDDTKIAITQGPKHFIEIAKKAIENGCTHLVCGGGDGSLNETLNGVMQGMEMLNEKEKNKIRLGVFPLGTGNDFIKTIKSPTTIEALHHSIKCGNYHEIDLGLLVFFSPNGEQQKRWFINIADVGMGGIVAEKLSRYSKWMGANLTYQRAIVSTLLSYKNQTISVKADSFDYNGGIMNFIIANGKYFGSGLGIAPDADLSDGKFSIVILGNISMIDYIKNLDKVKACKKIEHPNLIYQEAEQIELISENRLPIDMDGEFIGYSPLEASIVKKAIKFII